jgi:hypothetical protein
MYFVCFWVFLVATQFFMIMALRHIWCGDGYSQSVKLFEVTFFISYPFLE